jgi:hypothetical protein
MHVLIPSIRLFCPSGGRAATEEIFIWISRVFPFAPVVTFVIPNVDVCIELVGESLMFAERSNTFSTVSSGPCRTIEKAYQLAHINWSDSNVARVAKAKLLSDRKTPQDPPMALTQQLSF